MISEELATQIATFRFGVISEFVNGARLGYGERTRLLKEKSEREYDIPGTGRSRISPSTINLWIHQYRESKGRIESLKPKRRRDRGTYRKFDATIRMALKELRADNPRYTVPVMITKLKHKKIIGSDDKLNKASIYRFLKSEGLDKKQAAAADDRRRFEADYPNQIWQCDVMHGGPLIKVEAGSNKKAYLCAIMDDHSRMIVHAQFYLSEAFDSLKDCLHQAVMKRGIPQKFYVDNGACYRATHLEQVLAALGVGLTHSRPYTPQGRGKIERFFRYIRQDFMPLHADRPASLTELNERLDSWIDGYNARPHSTTKVSPYDRFKNNLACVRPAPDELLDYFRKIEQRRVKKDRTVQLNNRLFEVAVGLIDKRVELKFHIENPEDVEVFFEDRSYGKAVVLDPHVNARIGREGNQHYSTKPEPTEDEAAIATGKLFGGQEVSDES